MVDNVTTPLPAGTTIAADLISGVLYPRTKVTFGSDDSVVDVSASNPLPALDAASLAKLETIRALLATSASASKQDAIIAALAGTLIADSVIKGGGLNRGNGAVGTSALSLAPANSSRRGFSIQNQSSSATIYVSTQATATADFNSIQIGPGGYFESSTTHVGTGAISVISTEASTPVYAREW